MSMLKTLIGRRSLLKASALAGGGLSIGFSLFAAPSSLAKDASDAPDNWFEFNAFISIDTEGKIKIQVQNPEFGQGLMTSFPMIAAEELDANWDDIQTEMATFNSKDYTWQFSGGSRSINANFDTLRMAGAAARYMLRAAAANAWQVPIDEVNASNSTLTHSSGKSARYAEMAGPASLLPIPEKVSLKPPQDYSIIGTSRKNLLGRDIVTGTQKFGLDTRSEGMLYASIVHPPAFGLTLDTFDPSSVKGMPGIRDVFAIETYLDGYVQNYFDINAFNKVVVLVGDSSWQLFKAKQKLVAKWIPISDSEVSITNFISGAITKKKVPAGLESTENHNRQMDTLLHSELPIARRDGDPERAFAQAYHIIERTYHAPYLAHNTMEPMNFFADVQGDQVFMEGPHQGPQFVQDTIAKRLGVPKVNVHFKMTRMGGGFGRRAYPHFAVEAAVISQRVGRPILLTYTREDDMTMGIYRPSYRVKLRAAFNKDKQLIGYHVKAVGVPESPLFENRFPAGAIENYLAEGEKVESNITTGAFRAPGSNFMAAAEQSFLDEIAEVMNKDPIDLRLELLERAKRNPVGEKNDYDPERYAGVLRLVREKSGWNNSERKMGVAAYFCHASYAATVIDLDVQNGKPIFNRVVSAVDCGTVVNIDAAVNMAQGAVIDAIGNALYGEMTFVDGVPQKQNLDTYHQIRMHEAPKDIQVHFVKSDIHPTGLGEPPFPPTFAAVANALHKATGQRFCNQPFFRHIPSGEST